MQKIIGGKLWFPIALILCLAGAGARGQPTGSSDVAKRFIGTWRLVSIEGGNEQAVATRGPHPVGLIYYDNTGHMAVQIMPDRVRPKFAGAQPTGEEAQAALAGYMAYFGTYTVDEKTQTVIHHREGAINPGGLGDTVRHYEFMSDDRLILTPAGTSGDPNHLTWERIK
jgi:hypothetical protein